MDIIIWMLLGLIVIVCTVVVLVKSISQRSVNSGSELKIHNEALNEKVINLEQRVKKLEDEEKKRR